MCRGGTSAALGVRFRVRVNGQWTQTADYDLSTTTPAVQAGGRHYVRLNFVTPVTGLIECFFDGNLNVGGFNWTADSLSLPAADTYRGEIWSDNFGAGNANYPIRRTPMQHFGARMGLRDPVIQARAGNGWAYGPNITHLDRINLDAGVVATDFNFVALMNSVNDIGQTRATIVNNFVAGLQKAQATYSAATWVPCFVGLDRANSPQAAGDFAAIIAGLEAVADPRTLVIDISGLPKVTNTGTLPNGELHDSYDNVYPGQNESAYLAEQMALMFVAALEARL
jgi:hypothetical protein